MVGAIRHYCWGGKSVSGIGKRPPWSHWGLYHGIVVVVVVVVVVAIVVEIVVVSCLVRLRDCGFGCEKSSWGQNQWG